jgi:hypothetical protein
MRLIKKDYLRKWHSPDRRLGFKICQGFDQQVKGEAA